jgi:hypothetical protein
MGRTKKRTKDKEKLSLAVSDLKVLWNVWKIVSVFQLFVNKNLIDIPVEETYAKQYLCGHKLSNKAWKVVTWRNLCCFGPFMLMGIIQKPTEIIFHHKNSNFPIGIWRRNNRQTGTNV